MTAIPSLLDASVLPLPERMAARLDGEVYALGEAHCPVDVPETPALRLAAVLGDRSPLLIAELSTAAWVWGATPMMPTTLELCVPLGARAHRVTGPGSRVREAAIAPGEVRALDGHRVTDPLRTALDLARVRACFDPHEGELVRELARIGRFGLAECLEALDRRPRLPAKQRARERLRRTLEAQEALTR